MLVWEEGYKIGHPEMDAQHLVLFALLNQLDLNVNADAAEECIGDTLYALESYIAYHFAEEEKLLEAIAYPEIVGHKRSHRLFEAKIAELRAKAVGDNTLKAALQVRRFVLDWLLDHILQSDADYMRHKNSVGNASVS